MMHTDHTPHIASLRVGRLRRMGTEGASDPMDRPWESAIHKQPVDEPLHLGRTGFDGDEQADRKHHGGPDKAVCVYPSTHYPFWRAQYDLSLGPGAFGENVTLTGLAEAGVCIGDVYAVGEALVQVSQPRVPCWKLARRCRRKDMALLVRQSGRTGWYLRVQREGAVAAGQELTLHERPYPQWTVARANYAMHESDDPALLEALRACPALSSSWQDDLTKRLQRMRKTA